MIIEQKVGNKVFFMKVDSKDTKVIEYAKNKLANDVEYQINYKPKLDKWKSKYKVLENELNITKTKALQDITIVATSSELNLLREFNQENMCIEEGDFEILRMIVPSPIIEIVKNVRSKIEYKLLTNYWEAQQDLTKHAKNYPKRTETPNA